MVDREADLLIIGAGIVGLATALEVTRRFPRMRVVVVEKEDRVAAHQTGHNSGVIHSGLYYKTGSLKARNCVAGAASMKRFCQDNDVPYEECGKLVVATSEDEVTRLHGLHERGNANGVPGLRMMTRESSANWSHIARDWRLCTSPRLASLITGLSARSTPS